MRKMSTTIDIEKLREEKKIEDLLEFGIINIDKPSGPTSFAVTEYVKKKLGLRKTSHFGTLDPKVTGVLPIALNRACRLTGYFIKKDKCYVGIMRLHGEVSDKKLRSEMQNFVGKIKQLPPVRSRVKREERERHVYKFEILERKGKDVLFIAEVEAGTYIRKLVHDLGERIGGAHMLELRRIKAGIFSEDTAVDLYEFDKAVEAWQKLGDESKLREIIMPAEIIARILPVLEVWEWSMPRLKKGLPLFINFLRNKSDAERLKKDSYVAVFAKNKFVEVARVTQEGRVVARPEFVLTDLHRK